MPARSFLRPFLVVLAASAFSLPAVTPAAAGTTVPSVTVVASNLNSPRGLIWAGGGGFVVAEAGKGGSGPCGPGPLGTMCVGRSGAVTGIVDGTLSRLVHLPSIALPDGSFAFGTHDVGSLGGGPIYATIGLAGSPETREQWGPKGALLGHLVQVTPGGDVRAVADLAAYEASHNPAGGPVESDPFGLLVRRESNIVADAGANDLLRVSHEGRISTLAVFPDRAVPFQGQTVEMDAVPTTVVLGPDGAYYVGQLTGFPYPVGGARVYRVVPGQKPTIFARGFTNIIDIAFDSRGNLYVLEIAHNSLRASQPYGELIRVSPDGERTVLLDQGLSFPTSVVVRSPHRIYLTNCGVCPGGGEVLRLDL
jgi:sugar lactone lactonase YvrE